LREFQGQVTQASNTNPTVIGSTVGVRVEVNNVGSLVDALFVLPIDPDTSYVVGSAYGGAMPLTAAYTVQLAAERGLADLAGLASNAAPDDVVAVAFVGDVGTGERLDLGFSVKVTRQSGSVFHAMDMFDGSYRFQELSSSHLEIVDNGAYPHSHSRRFAAAEDTFINGSQPLQSYADAQTMWVGWYDQMRPLIHAPVTGIPPDAAVDEAYLYVYVVEGRGFANGSSSVLDVNAHRVTTDWISSSVSWWMPWHVPGADLGPAVGSHRMASWKVGMWVRFDVTDAVQDFVRSGENQGFILTSMAENLPVVRYGLATREHYSGNTPYVRVLYRTAH
jgi:hypothetical protein